MSHPSDPSTPSPRRRSPRKSLANAVPLPSPLANNTTTTSSSYSPSKRRRIEGPTLGDPIEATQLQQSNGLVDAPKARRESQTARSRSSLGIGERRKSMGSAIGSGGGEDADANPNHHLVQDSESTRYNARVEALNKAVDKFLELIDEAATAENFSTAVPQVSAASLDPIRLQLISDLKADLKSQHLEIVDDFNLNEKLRELQRLTEDADHRAAGSASGNGKQHRRDTWRPDLDIENASDAKGVQVQRENVAKTAQELDQIRAVNAQLYKELQDNMNEATAQQAETALFLDALHQAVASLRKQEEAGDLKSRIDGHLLALGDELGQRAS